MLLIVKVTRGSCFLSDILYLSSKNITVLPEYTSSFTLASSINMFFIEKIHHIKMEFPLLEVCLPAYSFVDIDTIMPVCTALFDTFQPLSCDVLASIIHKLNRTTCVLDPFSQLNYWCLIYPLSSILFYVLWIFVSRLVIFQHLASRQSFPLWTRSRFWDFEKLLACCILVIYFKLLKKLLLPKYIVIW